jgi:hypothetical protein
MGTEDPEETTDRITQAIESFDPENTMLKAYLGLRYKNMGLRGVFSLEASLIEIVNDVLDGLFSPGTTVVLRVPNTKVDNSVMKWITMYYSIYTGIKTHVTTYNGLVQSISAKDSIVDMLIHAPFIAMRYPEFVNNATWALATVLEIIEEKRNVLIVTSDWELSKNVLGQFIVSSLEQNGLVIV